MTQEQIDKYGMLLKVDDFFDDHTAETAAHSQIAPKHADLKDVIEDIEEEMAEAELDNTGVTEDKAALRLDLEQKVFTALTAVASFARDTNNRTLLKNVRFTLSDLGKMRDAVLFTKGETVRKKADANIAALAAYAYLPAQLTALGIALTAFHDSIPEPKDAIEASAVANEQVAVLLTQADGILEKLDGYMDTFRFSNAPLWSEYQMARAIDNAGGGTGGGGEDGYSASGTLTMMQTLTVLDFEYNADFTYTFTNSGPALVMEANLLQDGAPVAAAAPIPVNMGMPVTGQLGTWGPVGNQIMLRNTDMTMSLGYSVTLELP